MSHFTQIKVKFRDKQILCDALKSLGLTARICEHGMPIRDYGGRLTKNTAQVICEREQFCGNSNYGCADFGFEFTRGDEAIMHCDLYNNSKLSKIAKTPALLQEKIAQEYAYLKIRKQALSKGKTVHRVEENSKIKVYVNG
jgi:hypothetical protein